MEPARRGNISRNGFGMEVKTATAFIENLNIDGRGCGWLAQTTAQRHKHSRKYSASERERSSAKNATHTQNAAVDYSIVIDAIDRTCFFFCMRRY